MRFLANLLDDPADESCGVCDNCRGDSDQRELQVELVAEAERFLRKRPIDVAGKKMYFDEGVGTRRKIPANEQLEPDARSRSGATQAGANSSVTASCATAISTTASSILSPNSSRSGSPILHRSGSRPFRRCVDPNSWSPSPNGLPSGSGCRSSHSSRRPANDRFRRRNRTALTSRRTSKARSPLSARFHRLRCSSWTTWSTRVGR